MSYIVGRKYKRLRGDYTTKQASIKCGDIVTVTADLGNEKFTCAEFPGVEIWTFEYCWQLMPEEPQFKVGDLVRFLPNNDIRYDFKNDGNFAKPGDVFVISAAIMCGGESLYSVKGAYTQKPNWLHMDEFFERVEQTPENNNGFAPAPLKQPTPWPECIVWNESLEENNMKLTEIKKENLKEAKKQFDTERNNEEIAYAKQKLQELTDELNSIDREIQARQQKRNELLAELKVFKVK